MRTGRLLLIAVNVLALFLSASSVAAQENEQLFIEGRRYLDQNTRALEKYAKRTERIQQQVLAKLRRKEQRWTRRLCRKDSVTCEKLKAQGLSFDSIRNLRLRPDSAILVARYQKGGQKAIDSLKGVYAFLQSRASGLAGSTALRKAGELSGYGGQLNDLQQRLAYDQYLTELTNQHALSLQGIAGKNDDLVGIQKEVFYAKAKLAEWKKLSEEPSRLEERALEYLQGTRGFDLSMNQSLKSGCAAGGMGNAASADELEKLGFQTKRQLNTALQQRFGNSLQSVQSNMGGQLDEWQDKAQGLQRQVKETKQSLASLKHTEQPTFKVNPMRGKPFWLRLEKSYSFNTSRSSTLTDGTKRPAILSLAGAVAYRHTPKLSTGIGIAGDLGLGQSWSAIRLTFEGVGVRSFITWEWQYGIGAYAGYERTWKQYLFKRNAEQTATLSYSRHNRPDYAEAALIGLSKKYRINSRLSGSIQVLYDAWWMDKGMRSPVIIRFLNSN